MMRRAPDARGQRLQLQLCIRIRVDEGQRLAQPFGQRGEGRGFGRRGGGRGEEVHVRSLSAPRPACLIVLAVEAAMMGPRPSRMQGRPGRGDSMVAKSVAVGVDADDAAARITEKLRQLGDWRGATLAWVRARIHAADPAMREEWKWGGPPVGAHDGIVCTGESYKQVVKLTFAQGAALDDPAQLFNASLEGRVRRA